MQYNLDTKTKRAFRNPSDSIWRGLEWGSIGGLTGTLVMGFFHMGALSAVGLPALTGFSIIGNTAGGFFSMLGMQVAGGVSLGAAVYYLLGPAIGAIFGAVVTQVHALRVDSLKKGVVLAVVYVEILSQPILAATPILLKTTAAETLLWFGFSFVMHLIFGGVLGAIVSRELRPTISSLKAPMTHIIDDRSLRSIRGSRKSNMSTFTGRLSATMKPGDASWN
jgi:hypothetical protein